MREVNVTVVFKATARIAAGCMLAATLAFAASSKSDTVAAIDGKPILEADLNVQGELRRLELEAYKARRNAIEGVIGNRLIELEAQRLGESSEKLLQREVIGKVAEPADAAIKTFYEQRKAQIGEPLDKVKDKIAVYLRKQDLQSARENFVAELAAKREIHIFLEPPRLPVRLEGAASEGPTGAPVTIVEFSDFQCPYCKGVQPVLARLHERFKDQVRWVVKDLPLSQIHPQAQRAAEAAGCARDQNHHFEYPPGAVRRERPDGRLVCPDGGVARAE